MSSLDPFANQFDNSFNFNNRVARQPTSRRNLTDFTCDNGIMLEPRLQEYLKKKRYYRENGIDPPVPLEKQYQISRDDRNRLNRFFNGESGLYDTRKFPLEDKERPRYYFPSKKFREDPRVPKIKKPEMERVPNMGMFAPGSGESQYQESDPSVYGGGMYPMDSRDISSGEFYPDRMESLLDDQSNGMYNDEMYSEPRNQYEQMPPVRRVPPRQPNQRWNPYMEYNYKSSSYGTDQFDQVPLPSLNKQSRMEFDTRTVIPSMETYSRKDLNTARYNGVNSTRNGVGPGNVDIETSILHGMPSRTTKSYGYRNPEEHYFDYIDDTIQHPDNVVFPLPRGGVATRSGNHRRVGKPYNRRVF